MLEVQVRMVAEMERIREERPQGTVAIVSHGDAIKSAVMYYAGIAIDHLRRIEISPASVSVLEVRDWGPKLLLLNGLVGQAPWPVE
jgi:broad specificity phosphatase PhoE